MDRHLKEVGSLSYISTAPFNTYFWTYTVTKGPAPQFKQTGSLTNVVGATSINCPAGHVLRENGKRLYPPSYPGGPSPYPNIVSYMVGVYDVRNGLSGYINPNDAVFAPFNTERPAYQPDSRETTDNTTLNLGPSVYTLGPVTGNGAAIPANLTTTGQIRSTTVTNLGTAAAGNITIDVSLGQVFTLGPLAGSPGIILNQTTAPNYTGSIIYLIITGSTIPSSTFSVGSAGKNTNAFFANNTGISIGASGKAVMLFLCDGTNLYEVSRTGLY
jgi:hypothetical protein